jgi:hypothetical protein
MKQGALSPKKESHDNGETRTHRKNMTETRRKQMREKNERSKAQTRFNNEQTPRNCMALRREFKTTGYEDKSCHQYRCRWT